MRRFTLWVLPRWASETCEISTNCHEGAQGLLYDKINFHYNEAVKSRNNERKGDYNSLYRGKQIREFVIS